MTLSRRCATAVAVATVAGTVTHPTCEYRPSGGFAHRPRRGTPSPGPTRRAARPAEPRTQSPGDRLLAEPDPAGTAASAEPVKSIARPGLRKSWTWTARSPRVAR